MMGNGIHSIGTDISPPTPHPLTHLSFPNPFVSLGSTLDLTDSTRLKSSSLYVRLSHDTERQALHVAYVKINVEHYGSKIKI